MKQKLAIPDVISVKKRRGWQDGKGCQSRRKVNTDRQHPKADGQDFWKEHQRAYTARREKGIQNLSLPRKGIARSIALVKNFAKESIDPQSFYSLLAMDVVNLLSRYGPIANRLALDVGGGPGYTAQALSEAGARSVFIEYDPTEMGEGGRALGNGVIADGTNLPFASCTFDIATSLNVLEHVATPRKMMEELTRVVKPGGIVFITFTNWLSPWGGHETSPWHYLGGERAAAIYERRYGHPPKNRYGSSLFPLRISEFLRILNAIPDIVIVDVFPRYYPYWTRWITHLPGIREFTTWNLAVAARRI